MAITQILPSHNDLTPSLSDLAAQLVYRYPGFDEYDIAELAEERSGIQVTQVDFEALRAHYLRAKLQAWTPESEDTDE